MMKELVDEFDGDEFVTNGPEMITNVLKKLCNAKSVKEIMKRQHCEDFHILETELCYEVPYAEAEKFFHSQYTKEVMNRTKESLTVHFWNYISKTIILKKKSSAAYILKAKEFCPRVYKASHKYF